MNSINKQIKKLRDLANLIKRAGFATDGMAKLLNEAADTIESLSAKPRATILDFLGELEKEFPYKVPEQPDTYCKYNEAWQDCISRIEAFVDAQPEIDEWIPCNERLPEFGNKTYLVTYETATGKRHVRTCFYGGFKGSWSKKVSGNVIAWQPLPEAYHEIVDGGNT